MIKKKYKSRIIGLLLLIVAIVFDFVLKDKIKVSMINQDWFLIGVISLVHLFSIQFILMNHVPNVLKTKSQIENEKLRRKNKVLNLFDKSKPMINKLLNILIIISFILLFVSINPDFSSKRF